MTTRWIPMIGNYDINSDKIIFKGGLETTESGNHPKLGNLISDEYFNGGTITADVKFADITNSTAGCAIILYYEPETNYFLAAGLGGPYGSMYHVSAFTDKWANYAAGGEKSNIKAKKTYKLKATLKGSNVTLNIDGVDVINVNIPLALPKKQVGLWCLSRDEIEISNFSVTKEKAKAFVVMQYSSPYNELYEDVIKKICEQEYKIETIRADETYGPGIIISDIERQIKESKLIIADVSPANPNVYYEVGYSRALNKPTILIAEKETELPFDISPFRTLFYENSIAGKKVIEENLRKHLDTVLTERPDIN